MFMRESLPRGQPVANPENHRRGQQCRNATVAFPTAQSVSGLAGKPLPYRARATSAFFLDLLDLVRLPVDARSIGPQILERVILAGLRVEDVNHEIAVVLHDPARRLVTLDRETRVAP